MISDMKTWGKVTAVAALALLLTGCSAQDRGAQARDLCIGSAEDQIGHDVTPKDVNVTNMDDALYEAEIIDSRGTDDANAMFTVAGDVTWIDGSTENRKSFLCTVTFEDGQATETVKADLF